MDFAKQISTVLSQGLKSLYQMVINPDELKLEITRQDFKGDYTFVVFPYVKQSRKSPEQTATELGEFIKENLSLVDGYNVVKGFLNLQISDNGLLVFLAENSNRFDFLKTDFGKSEKVMVEYSSPNTNKPLHLGHIRNNLLGYSVAEILKANGFEVIKANLVNDRGIHICKSMLAWQQSGLNETPQTSGLKGDKLVGKYYVEFDKKYKSEIEQLKTNGLTEDEAAKKAPSILQAQEMLRKWEAGDEPTILLWKKMNDWVYQGFDITYKRLGVDFDRFYYESKTYLLGKEIVKEGLDKGVFFKKPDGSVWIDLTADGLDEKLLLRADGTSVYITQDIGTAELKFKDFGSNRSVYVVGNEQDYHFKVLKLILQKLGKSYANGVFHLSYGMVDLPSGKMKSREGTVVDADDLMDEMQQTAKEITVQLGKTEGMNEQQINQLSESIGLGALKYYLLKVDPTKRLLFNPAESIDFQGNTGPFIQYTHARISSLLERIKQEGISTNFDSNKIAAIHEIEHELIYTLYRFPDVLRQSAIQYSPAEIANYVYEVARIFNQFYHEMPVTKETNSELRAMRIGIVQMCGNVIRRCLNLLGIVAPERM